MASRVSDVGQRLKRTSAAHDARANARHKLSVSDGGVLLPGPPMPHLQADALERLQGLRRQGKTQLDTPTVGCPVCHADAPVQRNGDWRCACGTRGGRFKDGRLYIERHPGTPAAYEAVARLQAADAG